VSAARCTVFPASNRQGAKTHVAQVAEQKPPGQWLAESRYDLNRFHCRK
jgi:hypothetical protein